MAIIYRIVHAVFPIALLAITPLLQAASASVSIHDHAMLPEDKTMTLETVLESAMARYPMALELAARSEEASAWASRSHQWMSDSPSLSFRYQSDRPAGDNGLTEFEAGLQLSLWRWGERKSTRLLSQHMAAESVAAEKVMRWKVAGQLRNALWDIALAIDRYETARSRLDHATQLTLTIERRHALGDVALTDVLLAQAAKIEIEKSVIETEAAVRDAERAYSRTTGLVARPPFRHEVRSGRASIVTAHPALRFSDAQVARAQANHTVAEASAKGSPTVLIGPRRERGAFENQYDESIGVTVSVPIGGVTHTRAKLSASKRAIAAAKANHAQVRRELEFELHEATHRLNVIKDSLEASKLLSKISKKHYNIGESAYEKGELDLMDLLKLQTMAVDAERAVRLLETDHKRQIARYNQSVGVLF